MRSRNNITASMIQESLENITIEGSKTRHNIRNRMWKKQRKYQEELFWKLEIYELAHSKDKDQIAEKVDQILKITLMNLENLERMYLHEYCVDSFDNGPKNIKRRREEIKRECFKRKFDVRRYLFENK
jgi:hypothetical protein